MNGKTVVTMKVAVHPIQAAIWIAIQTGKLRTGMSLRAVGEVINETSAQKIKHHLDQLVKLGSINYTNGEYELYP